MAAPYPTEQRQVFATYPSGLYVTGAVGAASWNEMVSEVVEVVAICS